jgi:pilus assembly protein FimV
MRQMARWGVLPLLAAPVGTWALGLGDIELQSALNQPLRAQIRLSATQEEIQDLDISVADQATFQRYGLDRPAFLSTLQFEIGKNDAGSDVIFVRSPQAIAEPFVTMLIEASWPNGRSLREYTVLLDPPVFAPDNAAPVRQAQTPPPAAPARSAQPGGAIARQPAPPAPAPAPARTVAPSRAAQTPALGGTYGPVQRAETLWGIASRIKPAGVSMNQMLVAMYEANPQAFQGNMNLLRRGATLRIPDRASLGTMAASAATAEVRRQNQAWQAGSTGAGAGQEQAQARLRLVPPSEESGAGGSASSSASSGAPASTAAAGGSGAGAAEAAELRGRVDDLQSQLDESQRLLEVRDDQLRELQQRLAEATGGGAGAAPSDQQAAADAAAGVDLEGEQVFADEADSDTGAESPDAAATAAAANTAPPAADTTQQPPAPAATQPPPADVVSTTSAPPSPSLLSRVLSVVAKPVVLIGLGAGVVLLAALWYLRRRREEVEDVTGRWEALEREVDEEGADHETTARLRRQTDENEDFIVEETAAAAAPAAEPTSEPFEVPPLDEPAPAAADTASTGAFEMPGGTSDETMSSQTVINLDQADPVAEADFHMAYGLYDQAAELVSQALERDPDNRGLKLKLLEVFFVWGNKEAFLDAAKALRAEMGDTPDGDWDKVVIMGKQICPDDALFAEATAAAGEVDLDLDAGAGESPLDFAFEDNADEGVDLDLGGTEDADLQLEATGDREAPVAADAQAATGTHAAAAGPSDDDGLDIGEATSAGLEEALFGLDDDDTGRRTTPDIDSLAETQESPTVESPHAAFGQDDASAITMETPTVETPRAGADTGAPTVETPTVETSFASEPTVEHAGPGNDSSTELTAELDLDDLGLDVKDLESLPGDLGELPAAEDAQSDTREQPALEADTGEDEELLSATGVTQVLSGAEGEIDYEDTSVLGSNDETMLAQSPGDAAMTSTEVLEQPQEQAESVEARAAANGDSSGGLDLNLDDFSAALGGGDTVEQPRARSFTNDVFGGEGRTPVDLDVGTDVVGSDDPTGTEEVGPLDPQTMTEVGTKLDLARAYIDMGDPEGARSILEEVLDEGDAGQKREAQSLIDVLTA